MTITLKTITERAGAISDYIDTVNTGKFDIDKAREEAKQLYKDGHNLVKGELLQEPLIDQPITQLIKVMNHIFSIKGIYDHVPLQRILGKVYRIFIELRWHQSCRNEEKLPVLKDTRDDIIKNVKEVKSILIAREGVIDIQFELSCAKQSAKRLLIDRDVARKWLKGFKYLGHAISIGAAVVDMSASEAWNALKDLGKDIAKDCPRDWGLWYDDVHNLSWIANKVKTVADFNLYIAPEITKCKDKGSKYSICLAMLFMSIIKNSETERDLKIAAFRGQNGQPGLKDMIEWKHSSSLEGYLKNPSELWHKVAGKVDRFWKTRMLVIKYLVKLSRCKNCDPSHKKYALLNERYKLFHEESMNTLRVHSRRLKSGKQCMKEKKEIEDKFESLNVKKDKLKRRLDIIDDKIVSREQSARSQEEEDAVQGLIKEGHQIAQKIENIEKELCVKSNELILCNIEEKEQAAMEQFLNLLEN